MDRTSLGSCSIILRVILSYIEFVRLYSNYYTVILFIKYNQQHVYSSFNLATTRQRLPLFGLRDVGPGCVGIYKTLASVFGFVPKSIYASGTQMQMKNKCPLYKQVQTKDFVATSMPSNPELMFYGCLTVCTPSPFLLVLEILPIESSCISVLSPSSNQEWSSGDHPQRPGQSHHTILCGLAWQQYAAVSRRMQEVLGNHIECTILPSMILASQQPSVFLRPNRSTPCTVPTRDLSPFQPVSGVRCAGDGVERRGSAGQVAFTDDERLIGEAAKNQAPPGSGWAGAGWATSTVSGSLGFRCNDR